MKIYLKDSAQHGKGVFAAVPIATGEKILKFTGPLVQYSQLDHDDYHLQIGVELYLGPSGECDDYVNHCCNPNTTLDDDLNLVALRAISPDEEITWDYSTAIDEEDFPGFTCQCGAPNCRKIVRSFRHLELTDQLRLVPCLLAYLKTKYSIASEHQIIGAT